MQNAANCRDEADGNITDPIRAYEYLRLSSLAMHLLDSARIPSIKYNNSVTCSNSLIGCGHVSVIIVIP
jgi:hypothetical protein